LNERTVQVLEVSRRLVQEGEELAKSTTRIVKSIDALFAKLASHQSSEQVIESKLAPMIDSLTRAVNSLNASAETQAKNAEINLDHAESVVAAVDRLLQEIHASETTRSTKTLGTRSRDR
jgi:hypothetical protein